MWPRRYPGEPARIVGRFTEPRRPTVTGYITRKNNHWYVVIYEGLDPATGKERRKWHPAGTDR